MRSLSRLALFLSLFSTSAVAHAIPALRTDLARGPRFNQEAPFSAMFGISESMGVAATTGDVTSLRGQLEYTFLKDFGIGVRGSYRQPYGMDDPDYNGWGDVSTYIEDRALYTSDDQLFRIGGQLSYIEPTSQRAERTSMEGAIQAALRAHWISPYFSFDFSTEVGRYFYDYDTSDGFLETPNTPYSWNNRLAVTRRFSRKWRWTTSGTVNTREDYTNEIFNTYQLMTSVGWSPWDNKTSLTLGVRTEQSDHARGGFDSGATVSETGEASGVKPPAFFTAETTTVVMGLSTRF